MILKLILIPLILLFLRSIYRMLRLRNQLPPGPLPYPIFGNLLHLDPIRPHVSCKEFANLYGPVFTLWIGHAPAVMITDYKIMKDALTKHDQLASRPRLFSFECFSRGNYGVIMSTGEIWKEQRRFSLHTLRDFGLGKNIMEEKIMCEAKKLSGILIEQMNSNGRVKLDISEDLQLCVGSIIGQILFGSPFEKDDKKFQILRDTLNESLTTFSSLTVLLLDSFPWLRHIPLFKHFGMDDIRRQEQIMTNYILEHLENHKKAFEKMDTNEEPTDFIFAYLQEIHRRQSNNEDLSYFSDWQLKCILGDLIAAGMETTLTTLRWGILAMILNVDIQENVHLEIDSVLGREKTPTMIDRQFLPYTVAVVNEIQRWSNIISVNLQHTNDNDFLLAGYKIPKNTIVIPQISALAIDENVFPNPQDFRPERFLENGGKTLAKVEQFAPFSMGKRQCLGEGLARAELFLIFVHLMQKFRFSIPPGEKEPSTEPIASFALVPKPYECMVILK